MLEEIYALAQAFLGETGENMPLRAACKAAEDTLRARLRTGVTPADCRESFICAAAWMALAGFRSVTGSPTEFRMADVAVRTGGAAGPSLLTQAEILMAPWCSGGFAFRGVRT